MNAYKGKGKESDAIDLEVLEWSSEASASASGRRNFRSNASSSNIVQASNGPTSKVISYDQATNFKFSTPHDMRLEVVVNEVRSLSGELRVDGYGQGIFAAKEEYITCEVKLQEHDNKNWTLDNC